MELAAYIAIFIAGIVVGWFLRKYTIKTIEAIR